VKARSKAGAIIALLVAAVSLAACEDDAKKPYLEFAGGGFIFNYRNANHFYGFVARQKKPLPAGSIIEVQFEVPGGIQTVQQPSRQGQLQYMFQTDNLRGIVKDHPYKATLVLRDGVTGAELARYERTFATNVDQSTLPDKPLVIGPAYQQPPG
jgi:hypothetical protein